MPELSYPPKQSENEDMIRRLKAYYDESATPDAELLARVYQGSDITAVYERILFKAHETPDQPWKDQYAYDVTVVRTGANEEDPRNIRIENLSLKQLVASSLALVRPDLAQPGRQENQRQAEAEIQEISRVTIKIPLSLAKSTEIHKIEAVSITNNCTPAPSWELEVEYDGTSLHGSFAIQAIEVLWKEGRYDPKSCPCELGQADYLAMRVAMKGYDRFPREFYADYAQENPSKHILSVEFDTRDYLGKGYKKLASADELELVSTPDEPIDFGPFEESAKKTFDRGLLPVPGNGSPSERRRWQLTRHDEIVGGGKTELWAQLPGAPAGTVLTYKYIYQESQNSTNDPNGRFWLPHFAGNGLYYPISFGKEGPHRRPLDSLERLDEASIRVYEYGGGAKHISGEFRHSGTATDGLQSVVFGNIPVEAIPDESTQLYRCPTLNINRFSVGPRRKELEYDASFEPFENDHPLYAYVLGRKDKKGNLLIENTSFGVEQLHFQWRAMSLHTWIISFERVLPVFHAFIDFSALPELYKLVHTTPNLI